MEEVDLVSVYAEAEGGNMSGQSAHLTLREACDIQHRVQVSGTHAITHGGKGGKQPTVKAEKKPHTESKYEPSHMEGSGE